MASVEAGAPDDLAAALARCADEWRSQGWTLLPSLVPATEIDAALDDLWELFPTPAEFHGDAPDRRRGCPRAHGGRLVAHGGLEDR